jgi:uncharacterized protein (TIGR00266 family)
VQTQIEHQPSFAWLKVQLEPGEVIQAEAGAMVTMTPGLPMETRLNSGTGGVGRKIVAFFVALVRKFLGGETFFVNRFGGEGGGEVVLAPALSGDIMRIAMTPNTPPLIIQSGAYLASTGDIDTKLKWAGLRGLFGGEGLFFMECSGNGELFLNSYGGIIEVACEGSYIVDTGHIVAFDADLNFKVTTPGGGMLGFLGSGEGLVMEFKGQGRIWIQSRNLSALVGWVSPMLPT